MLLLAVAFAAAAPCPVTRSEAELVAALVAAHGAWAQADAAGFDGYVGDARAILPCVAAPLAPASAAAVHRVEGLSAFARRDGAGARKAFAAARAADPAWAPPEDLAPAGSPLRAEWDASTTRAGLVPLPPPEPGGLWLDGRAASARVAGRPVVFQYVVEANATDTTWVPAGGDVPAYPTRPVPVWAWAGAGVGLVGSGVLLALAYDADADYQGSASGAEADDHRSRVNGLAGGSVGLGAVGLGLGVIAVAGSF